MKPIAGLFLIFSLLMAIMVSPLHAQEETDDLYITSKDIEKKREKAKKEQVNPERIYYSYPQPGNGQTGSVSTNQEPDKFSQPGYTNKYIEAEKNEGIANSSGGVNTSQPVSQNYNNDIQSENVKWYKNNKRNLRRKAYGSQYTIAPVVGYNNYNGWNTGVSFGWNSGWNNWYGWNSPYYNGWNNYGYGGYGGYGMNYGYGGYGFYNPYSFGNYYYSPGWFVGYNSYSGWGSGFGWGYGAGYGYGGYYNPYAWGAWGNPYYGWRPAVYVPVNTYSNSNNGRATVNYGPSSSPGNYSDNRFINSNGQGNSYTNREQIYNQRYGGNQNQNRTESPNLTPATPQNNSGNNPYNYSYGGRNSQDNSGSPRQQAPVRERTYSQPDNNPYNYQYGGRGSLDGNNNNNNNNQRNSGGGSWGGGNSGGGSAPSGGGTIYHGGSGGGRNRP